MNLALIALSAFAVGFLTACGGGGSAASVPAVSQYTVSTTAGSGGTISPSTSAVNAGATMTLTITANSGFAISGASGCSGTLAGGTFTTGMINANCTVTASFVAQYAVTSLAGSNGAVAPASATVNSGGSATFNVTPESGYVVATVSGCGGSLSGSTYTTGTISANCSVTASFAAAFTWVGGPKTGGSPSVNGTLGVAAISNYPGTRWGMAQWKDASGNIWAFGGWGANAAPNAAQDSNELWKYSSSTGKWTWVSGSQIGGAAGIYGSLGVAAPTNVPGARDSAVSWIDSSGNLWLFGGNGFDSTGTNSWLSDLWMYSPSSGMWTWVAGSNVGNASGNYGTLGTASASNAPGARSFAAGWADTNGNLWLFGGWGWDASGFLSIMNDQWRYSISTGQWTWVAGSSHTGPTPVGVYGTQGIAASSNLPGARFTGATWTDTGGNFWMFGGSGYGTDSYSAGFLNDLWMFSPTTGLWTWVGGSTDWDAAGSYGTPGVASRSNLPSGRAGTAAWLDLNGNVWLFGGQGSNTGWVNDFWNYSPGSGAWTLIEGSAALNGPGGYGTQGVAAATNVPGARTSMLTWTDANGTLWLFGGMGKDSAGTSTVLNDMWKYPTQ